MVDRRFIFGDTEEEHFVALMRKLEGFLGLRNCGGRQFVAGILSPADAGNRMFVQWSLLGSVGGSEGDDAGAVGEVAGAEFGKGEADARIPCAASRCAEIESE